MKTLHAIALAAICFSPALASAQTVNCPNVGKLLLNGDSMIIAYAPAMGFSDNTDTGSFISKGGSTTDYQANKWGALISIPNSLLDGRSRTGEVTFFLPETAPQREICSAD